MKTKTITLYYKLTPKQIIAPQAESIVRKDEWIKEIQKTIPSAWESKIVKVKYELHNPEVDQQIKFFNGTVVDYFAIQSQDILSGDIPSITRKQAREQLLDSALGYDLKMLTKTTRRRKSTADFTNTQQWNDCLEALRELEFEPNGYEFPNSEKFWELAKEHGYDQAKEISIEQLRKRLISKTSDLSTVA